MCAFLKDFLNGNALAVLKKMGPTRLPYRGITREDIASTFGVKATTSQVSD